jgi:hypothetical protein
MRKFQRKIIIISIANYTPKSIEVNYGENWESKEEKN